MPRKAAEDRKAKQPLRRFCLQQSRGRVLTSTAHGGRERRVPAVGTLAASLPHPCLLSGSRTTIGGGQGQTLNGKGGWQ